MSTTRSLSKKIVFALITNNCRERELLATIRAWFQRRTPLVAKKPIERSGALNSKGFENTPFSSDDSRRQKNEDQSYSRNERTTIGQYKIRQVGKVLHNSCPHWLHRLIDVEQQKGPKPTRTVCLGMASMSTIFRSCRLLNRLNPLQWTKQRVIKPGWAGRSFSWTFDCGLPEEAIDAWSR